MNVHLAHCVRRHLEPQHPRLVGCIGRLGIDVLAQLDPALEGPVLDLDLVVAGTGRMRALTYAGDDERAADGDDPHGGRVDARELEQDVQSRRIVGAVAIALRLEATPRA